MPESERPERALEIDRALDRLTSAVDRVLSDYASVLARSDELQREYASLREAVSETGGVAAGDMDQRLAQLAAENKTLREILLEARERAKRIRSRLAVVEDEV